MDYTADYKQHRQNIMDREHRTNTSLPGNKVIRKVLGLIMKQMVNYSNYKKELIIISFKSVVIIRFCEFLRKYFYSLKSFIADYQMLIDFMKLENLQ